MRIGALVEGVKDQNRIHQAIVVELTHQFHLSHLDKDVAGRGSHEFPTTM